MKKIVILGSTGSIGTQALDIVARHPDRFAVVGLVAGNNLELLQKQIQQFHPAWVSVSQEEKARSLRQSLGPKVHVLSGTDGACEVISQSGADLVLSAIVGAAGLLPTYQALSEGKTVALANKESLVIAGEVMTRRAKEKGAILLPVDSEHSAIFQALAGNRRQDLRRIILTASGGPFFRRQESFETITVEQALKHPNWDMGAKITIDSATLMNKGLEVIEASWLFGLGPMALPPEQITIHIHPQSIIHSLVEYIDGSVLAQLGVPDMRCAISYAMAYPERVESGVKSLDLLAVEKLDFYRPDLKKFPCLGLAFEAIRAGKTMPAVLNAANEIAVERFLQKKIGFNDIPRLIERVMQAHTLVPLKSLEDVTAADQWAREYTRQL